MSLHRNTDMTVRISNLCPSVHKLSQLSYLHEFQSWAPSFKIMCSQIYLFIYLHIISSISYCAVAAWCLWHLFFHSLFSSSLFPLFLASNFQVQLYASTSVDVQHVVQLNPPVLICCSFAVVHMMNNICCTITRLKHKWLRMM